MLNLFMYIFCSNLLVTLIETFSVSAFCSSKGHLKPYVEMNFNAVPRLSEKECNDHLVILWLWKYSGSIFAKYLLSLMYLIEDNTFGSSPVLCVWLHIYTFLVSQCISSPVYSKVCLPPQPGKNIRAPF